MTISKYGVLFPKMVAENAKYSRHIYVMLSFQNIKYAKHISQLGDNYIIARN